MRGHCLKFLLIVSLGLVYYGGWEFEHELIRCPGGLECLAAGDSISTSMFGYGVVN